MKKKVLIFPCGSEIGLEINRALKYSKDFEVVGGSSLVSNHGEYVYKHYIEDIPFVEEEDFIDKLNLIIDKESIDYIFPAHDSVLMKLSKETKKLYCDVIASPYDTCNICRSKKKTYEFFYEKIQTPEVYKSIEDIKKLPVFLKPDVGQGSKGTFMANSVEEVEFYMNLDPSLIILEFLPGREYTIDCFTNRKGEVKFIGGRERNRICNGISSNTFPVEREEFNIMAKAINEVLDLRGAWFFQVKERVDGELVLMEIEPRIAGSMGLTRNLGVNLPLLTLFDREGIDIQIIKNNYFLKMDRATINRFSSDLYYDKVYLDLDDTLIIDNKINALLMAYIYQCINEDIEVHLISKHDGNILEYLKRYKIDNVFSSVVHLKEHEEKFQFINRENSIFIDDSFKERFKVLDKLNIPVLDISEVESLIRWNR